MGKTDGALRAGELGQQSGVNRRYGYDGVDHPLWMYEREEEAIVWYEVDVIGNVRRLRGGPVIPGFLQHRTDLGGYKYTAFGKLLPPDAGTPLPSWNPLGTQLLDQPLRWQGRWFVDMAGGIYDFRNRWWSPEIGAFLSPERFQAIFFSIARSRVSWSSSFVCSAR